MALIDMRRLLLVLVAASWLGSICAADTQSSLRGRISSLSLQLPVERHQEGLKDQEEPTRKISRGLEGAAVDSAAESVVASPQARAIETPPAATEVEESKEATDDNIPDKKPKGQQDTNSETNQSTAKSEEDDLETIEKELEDEERMVREVGGYGAVLAIIAMIFTAWQMNDNPDGIFATMCRLVITVCSIVIGLLLTPCRRCIGPARTSHTYGHVPVAPSNLEFGFT